MNFDLLNGAAPLALPVAIDVVLVGFLAYALVTPHPDGHGVRHRGVIEHTRPADGSARNPARPRHPGRHRQTTGRQGRPALSVSTAVTDSAGTIWPARTGRAP
jgi:hypothetical protein